MKQRKNWWESKKKPMSFKWLVLEATENDGLRVLLKHLLQPNEVGRPWVGGEYSTIGMMTQLMAEVFQRKSNNAEDRTKKIVHWSSADILRSNEPKQQPTLASTGGSGSKWIFGRKVSFLPITSTIFNNRPVSSRRVLSLILENSCQRARRINQCSSG